MKTTSHSARRADAALRSPDVRLEEYGLVRSPRRRARGSQPAPGVAEAGAEEIAPLQVQASNLRVAANGVRWLAAPRWERFGWLWHGFSTRQGGVSRAYAKDPSQGELNLGLTAADDANAVAANRRLLAEAITGEANTPLVTLRQIHSNFVLRSGCESLDGGPCKADGLMTAEPGILLAVQTADCIPILVADRKRRVVAGFHAGWRGTVQRIVESGIGRMRLEFGSRPEDLIAAIGPGIGQCCYSVGDEVLAAFESQFAYARELFVEVDETDPVRKKFPMMFLNQRAPGHGPVEKRLHLDLTEANQRQLIDAGIKSRSIRVVGGCTSCQPELFFSHRASGGYAGRMMSVIGIRP
jgi:polyphenol oxidase